MSRDFTHPSAPQHLLGTLSPPTVTTLYGFGIRSERTNGSTRLFLSGELDMANVNLVDETLSAAQGNHGGVEIDLEGLTFMDSSGVEVFLGAAQRADKNGGRFRIINSQELRRIFEMTRTTALLGPQGSV